MGVGLFPSLTVSHLQKHFLLAFALLTSLLFIPQVSANHSPPPFLSGQIAVESEVGIQRYDFNFTLSPEDTPDTPTFEYHLWDGLFIPTDHGDVSTLTDYSVDGTIVSFSLWVLDSELLQASWIEAYDGNDTLLSCPLLWYQTSSEQGIQLSCGASGFGVAAFVEEDKPAPQEDTIEIRFPFIDQDPNPSQGELTYSLWASIPGSGDLQLIPDVSSQPTYQAANGLGSFDLNLGGTETNYQWFLSTVVENFTVQSCRIEINTSEEGSQTVCGSMESVWVEAYCVPRTPTEANTGFSYRENVNILDDIEAFTFFREADEPGQSLAAINLPGDTRSQRFYYTIEADLESAESNFNFLFSTKPGAATAANKPDETSLRPVTGAFSDGYGVHLHEEGNDWQYAIYHHVNGFEQLLSDGELPHEPNEPNSGYFELDAWEGILTFTMGGATIIHDLDDDLPQPGSAYSFWMRENGGNVFLGFEFPAETFLYYDTAQNLCLYKTSNGFPPINNYAIGQEQTALPQFSGNGGYLGEPAFPGLNVSMFDGVIFDLDTETVAWILAGVLAIICAVAFGPITGAGIGLVIAAGLAAALSLIPAWLLVVIFLALVALVVLREKGLAT